MARSKKTILLPQKQCFLLVYSAVDFQLALVLLFFCSAKSRPGLCRYSFADILTWHYDLEFWQNRSLSWLAPLPLSSLGRLCRIHQFIHMDHKPLVRDAQFMQIVITGSSGLIGQALTPFLIAEGNQLIQLFHKKPGAPTTNTTWDYHERIIDTQLLEGSDAIIHLAGANIAAGRWTQSQKEQIQMSRTQGTAFLCETLASLKTPPKVLICASAIGYYGSRGAESLNEASGPGKGFLANCCMEWEKAAKAASDRGIRVVNLRLGMVLSAAGGALAKMLTPFKLGMGGMIGDGSQYMSWISIDDVIGAIDHILKTDALQGPVNAVSPNPVSNRTFTETLGKVLSRPAAIPLPAFAARMMFGDMADELLLSSTRVLPDKLLSSHYRFSFPDLEECLRHLLILHK